MIAIVTDSTAYFTKRHAQELGVYIVPLSYSINSQTYNEDFSDYNMNISTTLKQEPLSVSTSQAPVWAFKNIFKELTDKGHEVLCIVLSSRLSGTYSSASIAAKEFNENKVMVIDSLTTAGGLQLLVKEALNLSKSGIYLKQLYDKIEKVKVHIGLVFTVDDIGPLRRSGRLGAVQQSITTVLNIRPILACQKGTVVALGLARGRSAQINKLAELVPKTAKEVIAHFIDDDSVTKTFCEKITHIFSNMKVSLIKIGPVLETHIGSGILGLAWINKYSEE